MADAGLLLSFPQLQSLIGRPARCTVVRWIKQGTFPAPVKIGPRRIAWRTRDIDVWLSNRERVATHAPPSTRDGEAGNAA
jgi:prophage regulatory protein